MPKSFRITSITATAISTPPRILTHLGAPGYWWSESLFISVICCRVPSIAHDSARTYQNAHDPDDGAALSARIIGSSAGHRLSPPDDSAFNRPTEITNAVGLYEMFARARRYNVVTAAPERQRTMHTGERPILPHYSLTEVDHLVPISTSARIWRRAMRQQKGRGRKRLEPVGDVLQRLLESSRIRDRVDVLDTSVGHSHFDAPPVLR